MAAVQEAMRHQNFVLMAADAELEPVEEPGRRSALAGVAGLVAVRELSRLFSRLDLALMIDWSQKRVQTDLLRSVHKPWSNALIARVNAGDHLLTARSLGQLMREVLEYASVDPDAPEITLPTLVHYLLSINTEHYRHPEYSATGLITDNGHRVMAQQLSGMSAEDSIAMLRGLMPGEIANTLADATLSPIALRADAEDTWFRSWPDKVVHPGLGDCPAESFARVHGVALVEILALGKIIDDLTRKGVAEFSRAQLLAQGGTEAAVELCIKEMSRPLDQYRDALAGDRRRGSVHQQRYTMTRFPFLRIDSDTIILLRYQWGIDRFYGNLLYWSTFAGMPGFKMPAPKPKSQAEAFSSGMNHVFERSVGDILETLVARSASADKLITENEMQTAWTTSSRATASACDWVIKAGKTCIIIDATNYSLDAFLSQGLGTPEAYAEDMDKIFASNDGKFGQLAKTMRKLRDRGVDDFDLDPKTVFLPIVALPSGGIPNIDTTDLDFQLRSRPFFEEFDGRILAPVAVTITELQILEGMAGRIQFPDPVKTVVQWRHACTLTTWPIRFRDYLDGALSNPDRPLSSRTLANNKALLTRVAGVE
ncbi:hypothetical protein CH294_12065 [Rhodococcus sp. 14-2483-1-1]|nr:hypothetical protein CH294_12065 [Rhodococcus sp. 14-2483-1-1]